jgi:HEAT repeat protein
MITVGTTESNLETLVFQALKGYEDVALVQFLYDENSIVHSAAARELQLRGSKVAFDAAIDLIREDASRLRDIGCFLLGQIGRDRPFRNESLPILIDRLRRDSSDDVRSQSAAALGHLEADAAAEELIVAATDQSVLVRAAVASAIGRLTPTAKLHTTLEMLSRDVDEGVREWAEVSTELYETR